MEKQNRPKYKFGQDEIDLKNYIHNLDTNAQSYLNSRNWSNDQKQEFMTSYNNLLSKFREQLDNNTNRFSTDTFGTIIDSNGEISNDDNVEGTQFYYDDSGNKISSQDYNNLKDRKKKNYSQFYANKEVASYFNIIGNALRNKIDKSQPSSSNKFDLSQQGFVPTWSKTNNPSGGDFDLTPYVNLDEPQEDGTRKTEKRVQYLQQELQNYLNNGNYTNLDFSETSYKNVESYKNSIQNAINALNNGYNSESIIALNKAGISSDFLNPFFKTKNNEEVDENEEGDSVEEQYKKLGYTDEQISTIMQAQQIQEQQQKEGLVQQAQEIINNRNMEQWINSLKNKPFQSRVNLNLSTYKPAYNEKWVVDNFNRSYNKDALNWLNHELQLNYFIDPNKQRVFRGKLNNTYQHLSNNLDWAIKSRMLDNNKISENLYAIPTTLDYDRQSVIVYNPNSGQVQEVSLLNYLDSPKVQKWLSNYYYNNVAKHKEGGVLKYQSGGDFDNFYNYINNFEQNQKQKQEQTKQIEKQQRELNNGYNPKDNVTPHTELSKADMLRLTAIAGDLGSLIANFTGVGSVASAGIGATSTALNQAADMAEGQGFWQSLGNNLTSYGLDAISVLPFAKAAKIPKMIKTLAKFTPYVTGAISSAQGIANAPEMLNSWSKIKNGQDLTIADWRNIANSIQIVLGGTAATGRAIKANKKVNAALSDTHSWLKTNNGYRKVSNGDIQKIQGMSSLEEQNKFLKEKYGVTISKQKNLFKRKKNETGNIKTQEYYDFSKPVTLYSGDLPYTRKFGWGERAIGNLQVPSLPNIDIRNAYNRVVHPQAYKRKYGKKSNKKYKSDFISRKYNQFRDWLDGEVEIEKDGGTLNFKIKKFQNAGKITLNNGVVDWDSLSDPKKDILWPGSAEYSKSPLSKYVVPRLGTSSGVNNVSKSQNYSFDTNSRLKSMIDRLKNNIISPDNISEMQRRHWGMYYTWQPQDTPIYKEQVANYQTDYQNLGLNDEIIAPGYSNNYIINSPNPNSGDSIPNWTSDGLYSQITDDRRVLARKADYDNNLEQLKKDIEYAKQNGYEYYLDPETDYYMLRPLQANENTSNISKLEISNNQPTSKPNNIKGLNIFSNPTLTYGLPRALYADWMNRKMTDLAIKSTNPVLQDPFIFHRYTRSDLDSEMQGEKNYASLVNLANRPTTSSGENYDALRLEAELKGQEAKNKGRQLSNQVQRQYDELAWQQEKENAKNIHDTSASNNIELNRAIQDKNNFKLAYLSKKHNIWDVLGQQFEFEARQKRDENKALKDKFAIQDIHNAIYNNPNAYGTNLTPEELNVWNLVLSGVQPSSLKDKLNLYLTASKKVSQAENNQLRNYYSIPYTKWSNTTPQSQFTPNINFIKNGKKINTKEQDIKRFYKQIKDSIDRNEKAIERLSKSMSKLTKK